MLLLPKLVPPQALLPPVHPDEVSVADLLVARSDYPSAPYLWNAATTVRGTGLADVVAPGEDGLAAQVVVCGAAFVTCSDTYSNAQRYHPYH